MSVPTPFRVQVLADLAHTEILADGEITNTCTCDPADSLQCDGEFCYADAIDRLGEEMRHLIDANPDAWWRVEGLRLWDGERHGDFPARIIDDIVRGMTIRGEWFMRYRVYGNRVEYSLSHHDAPTGSNTILRPTTREYVPFRN